MKIILSLIAIITTVFSQDYFQPVGSTGLPYTVVITDAMMNGNILINGSEIGLFDEDLCVGAGIWDESDNLAITAWESYPGLGMEGFSFGSPILFRVWAVNTDTEYSAGAQYEQGDGTFGYGSFAAASITVESLQGDINADGALNVVDIVMLVNLITSGNYNIVGDINQDGGLNVLDVVLMVDIIMSF